MEGASSPTGSRRDYQKASGVADAVRLARRRKWVRLREVGWFLIGAWQVLLLASEFVPIDLEQRAVRILGKVLGLLGLVLVAYGFERLMKIAETKVDEADPEGAASARARS